MTYRGLYPSSGTVQGHEVEGYVMGWCDYCCGMGYIECECGGDQCVCGLMDYPCPECGGSPPEDDETEDVDAANE